MKNSDKKKGAIISPCGNYRYSLWRIWNDRLPKVMFIMLNPSTADADLDDPTIRRCIGFARSWGFGGLYVGNLFAFRATNPKELLQSVDPIGEDNRYHLESMSEKCEFAVVAWGNSGIIKKLLPSYMPLRSVKIPLRYLELSIDGTPKHPLYLKSNLKPKGGSPVRTNLWW